MAYKNRDGCQGLNLLPSRSGLWHLSDLEGSSIWLKGAEPRQNLGYYIFVLPRTLALSILCKLGWVTSPMPFPSLWCIPTLTLRLCSNYRTLRITRDGGRHPSHGNFLGNVWVARRETTGAKSAIKLEKAGRCHLHVFKEHYQKFQVPIDEGVTP